MQNCLLQFFPPSALSRLFLLLSFTSSLSTAIMQLHHKNGKRIAYSILQLFVVFFDSHHIKLFISAQIPYLHIVIIQMFICRWEMNLRRNGIVISDSKYMDIYFNMDIIHDKLEKICVCKCCCTQHSTVFPSPCALMHCSIDEDAVNSLLLESYDILKRLTALCVLCTFGSDYKSFRSFECYVLHVSVWHFYYHNITCNNTFYFRSPTENER